MLKTSTNRQLHTVGKGKVIKDGRTLTAVCQKYGMRYDATRKCITNSGGHNFRQTVLECNGKHYQVREKKNTKTGKHDQWLVQI